MCKKIRRLRKKKALFELCDVTKLARTGSFENVNYAYKNGSHFMQVTGKSKTSVMYSAFKATKIITFSRAISCLNSEANYTVSDN
jgi:3-keto-L-gulonate-6-phosphate decarboxylase